MSTGVHQSPDILPAFLAALHVRSSQRIPVWFMRQAGRSLPEYRALRAAANRDMLSVCLDPTLAAEATLQPVRRHGVDAAVFFSDIMVPLRLAGVDVRIEPGIGPVIATPVRSREDIAALTRHRYDDAHTDGVAALTDAIHAVVAELGSPLTPPAHLTASTPLTPTGRPLHEREIAGLAHSHGEAGWTPVIGFGGAPFTLAAYLVEGRPSRDHLAARTLMHADPDAWHDLMAWCAHLTGAFITTQIEAGASAAQLFDSWAGSLSPELYRRHVAPYSALALDLAHQAISPTTGQRAPLIHFGTGTARILSDMRDAGADAVGIDDRTDLREGLTALSRSAAGPCPVQGNLDPALLGAPQAVIEREVAACVEAGRHAPGHVVNLGHGVPPTTSPEVLTAIVAQVHDDTAWARTAHHPWAGPHDESPAVASPRPAAAHTTTRPQDSHHD